VQTHKLLIPTLFLAATFAGAAGFMLAESIFSESGADPEAAPEQASRAQVRLRRSLVRPAFTLSDLSGRSHQVSEWDGKLLLINFWAPWCAPCREEIPDLMAARERYVAQGLEVVGIAMDEPDAVREFVAEMGMKYPVLVGQERVMQVSRAYGNDLGALPYTALVDRSGRIVFTRRGILHRAELESLIKEWL